MIERPGGDLVEWLCSHKKGWDEDDLCVACGEPRPLEDILKEHQALYQEGRRAMTKLYRFICRTKGHRAGKYIRGFRQLRQTHELLFRLYKNLEPAKVGEDRLLRYDEVATPRRVIEESAPSSER